MNLDFNKPVKCPHCGTPTAILESAVSESCSEPCIFRVKCWLCGSAYDLTRLEFEKNSLTKQNDVEEKKEATMKVTYNGFTGELVKLERRIIPGDFLRGREGAIVFDLSIYDSEKEVTHSFTGVKLADVKFLGGTATMSGTLNIGEVAFK